LLAQYTPINKARERVTMAFLKSKQELEAERIAIEQARKGDYPLPINRLALVYSRYSTAEQARKGIKQGLEQASEMILLASEHGWTRELMLLFIENNVAKDGRIKSVSGTLPIEVRGQLSTIIEEYVNKDKAGAIVCDDISRLTRDADLVDAAVLAKACRTHNVVIVTRERVYDFRRKGDYKAYIAEAEAAASWLETHLRGKMLRNRTRRAEQGKVGCRIAPIGLMLDDTRDNLKPSPHASRVNWLYLRFRAHSASLSGLLREIKTMEIAGIPLFPVDSRIDPKTIFAEPMYQGETLIGWTIRTRAGLQYLLSNPAYLGMIVFNGRIMKEDAFPAIVDRDLWEFANQALGKTDLDGNPIDRPKRAVRYERRGSNNMALLAGTRIDGRLVIDGHKGQHVYVQPTVTPGRTAYVLKDLSTSVHGYITSIASSRLDMIIEQRILYWLGISQRQFDNKDIRPGIPRSGPSPRHAAMAVDATTPAVPQKTIHQALTETREELAKVNRRLDVAGDTMSESTLRETYAKQNRLEQREREQVKTIEQADRVAREQEQGRRDIRRAHHLYSGWKLDKKRQFVRLVTDGIYLEKQADDSLRLTIVYSPIMGLANSLADRAVDTAIIQREPESVDWAYRHDSECELSRSFSISL
jgi:hypothetical protein